jgi:two-component system, NtrC family, nitrogen regulation response regulator NtrX
VSANPEPRTLSQAPGTDAGASPILIVDDEAGVRASLGGVLRDEGYAVDAVDSGEACLDQINRRPYEVVLLDIWLPGIDGLVTLERLRDRRVNAQIIMISGHANIESAVRATKLGAFDFIEKPLSLQKTVLSVRNALRQGRLEAENRALRARVDRRYAMVGESRAMAALREQIAMAAPTNGRVLISGENGTGKELVARQVHQLSHRRTGPFIEVNCAALPEELIESELFGHARGAFTGAVADRRGKFEIASGGTLFLDEVGDMSLKTQAKVLRALQEQVVEPVGGQSSIRVDVRVIAATNKNLADEIRLGQFREDLYFRLNVIPVLVPPLRERGDDILRLAEHFVAEFAREYGRRRKVLDPGAIEAVTRYVWPGNVRELRNVIERLMIMVPGDVISAGDLPFTAGTPRDPRAVDQGGVRPLFDARDAWERAYILAALSAFDGNISRTAEVLGLERSNLYKKMRSLGIPSARERDEP